MSADSDYEAYKSESPLPEDLRGYLNYLKDPAKAKAMLRRVKHSESHVELAELEQKALSERQGEVGEEHIVSDSEIKPYVAQ